MERVVHLANISDSNVIQYQNNTPNAFPVILPNSSYALGVQLTAVNYTESGGSVNVVWSLRALLPGDYWVQAMDLDWENFVVSPSASGVNATSGTFPSMQYCEGGTNVD